MYNRPKRINNLKNTLFKIKFKNINSRHSISNAYVKVEIFNNEGTTNLEIVLDNLIDILEHDNIHNNISDNEYFVVRDNNYYLVNDKLSIYNKVMNDLDERKKLDKKTTKYKIGGIYGSINNQYLYLLDYLGFPVFDRRIHFQTFHQNNLLKTLSFHNLLNNSIFYFIQVILDSIF